MAAVHPLLVECQWLDEDEYDVDSFDRRQTCFFVSLSTSILDFCRFVSLFLCLLVFSTFVQICIVLVLVLQLIASFVRRCPFGPVTV